MNRKQKLKWLAEFYAGAALGKQIQSYSPYNNKWKDNIGGPNTHSNPDQWRLVDGPKPVDMQVLIDMKIDCEFLDSRMRPVVMSISELVQISGRGYRDKWGCTWRYCKPRMKCWMAADNHPPQTIHNLINAGFAVETFTSNPLTIFKIVGLQDDRCWSWEAEE